MNDEILEYLKEIRERWNDSYYWADHQIEAMVVAAILTGFIGLFFTYLKLKLEARYVTG